MLYMPQEERPWAFYIIANGPRTYAGVSPDPTRRLRQHNAEIVGGAKYTTAHAPGWVHVCLVRGFQDKIQAMQFEWAVKHQPPRNLGGVAQRLRKLYAPCAKESWTSKAPLSCEVPLTVEFCPPYAAPALALPDCVSVQDRPCSPPEPAEAAASRPESPSHQAQA